MNKQQLQMAGVEAMEAGVCAHLDALGLTEPTGDSCKGCPGGCAPLTQEEKLATLIMAALDRQDRTGFCVECLREHSDCDPDTRARACEGCGKHKVYGAEELVLMGYADAWGQTPTETE